MSFTSTSLFSSVSMISILGYSTIFVIIAFFTIRQARRSWRRRRHGRRIELDGVELLPTTTTNVSPRFRDSPLPPPLPSERSSSSTSSPKKKVHTHTGSTTSVLPSLVISSSPSPSSFSHHSRSASHTNLVKLAGTSNLERPKSPINLGLSSPGSRRTFSSSSSSSSNRKRSRSFGSSELSFMNSRRQGHPYVPLPTPLRRPFSSEPEPDTEGFSEGVSFDDDDDDDVKVQPSLFGTLVDLSSNSSSTSGVTTTTTTATATTNPFSTESSKTKRTYSTDDDPFLTDQLWNNDNQQRETRGEEGGEEVLLIDFSTGMNTREQTERSSKGMMKPLEVEFGVESEELLEDALGTDVRLGSGSGSGSGDGSVVKKGEGEIGTGYDRDDEGQALEKDQQEEDVDSIGWSWGFNESVWSSSGSTSTGSGTGSGPGLGGTIGDSFDQDARILQVDEIRPDSALVSKPIVELEPSCSSSPSEPVLGLGLGSSSVNRDDGSFVRQVEEEVQVHSRDQWLHPTSSSLLSYTPSPGSSPGTVTIEVVSPVDGPEREDEEEEEKDEGTREKKNTKKEEELLPKDEDKVSSVFGERRENILDFNDDDFDDNDRYDCVTVDVVFDRLGDDGDGSDDGDGEQRQRQDGMDRDRDMDMERDGEEEEDEDEDGDDEQVKEGITELGTVRVVVEPEVIPLAPESEDGPLFGDRDRDEGAVEDEEEELEGVELTVPFSQPHPLSPPHSNEDEIHLTGLGEVSSSSDGFVQQEEFPDPEELPLPDIVLPPAPVSGLGLKLKDLALPSVSVQTQDLSLVGTSPKSPSPPPPSSSSTSNSPTQIPTPPASPPGSPAPAQRRALLREARERERREKERDVFSPTTTFTPTLLTTSAASSPVISTAATAAAVKPAWSIRAADAPALGISRSVSSPLVGKKELVVESEKEGSSKGTEEEGQEPEKKLEEKEVEKEKELKPVAPVTPKATSPIPTFGITRSTSLPGSFPVDVHPLLDEPPAVTPAPNESSSENPTSTSTSTSKALTTATKRIRPTRSPIDIALAMQLRPGLGVGADPAWMVRFLMAMFGWFVVLISGTSGVGGYGAASVGVPVVGMRRTK
ncbi:hypothetical protein K435DRAFT_856602 [Dendrothele bispora CBS 962.96]|uniref:Transmembrane protein n=1 Tax=Dendrothele bispora (strain CBS 962.96) TaxID=1314807 RepID=A0A4S8M9C0_DENBC|nr:hypothetical protein K435DRAFT_856602 [Dendrothele bispora CBS 962.96]